MAFRVRLVLVGTEGEVNLGFAARLAANFSVDEFYLVNPVASIGETARRFAAKAKDVLEEARVVQSLDEALEGVGIAACTSARIGKDSDVLRHPITPRELASLAERVDSIAVVFGRESTGLTREEIAKCDVLVSIPANPEYPVLNLTHAVAIILYELWLKRENAEKLMPRKADEQHIKRLTSLYETIAHAVYGEKPEAERAAAALKHCIVKASLTAGEASSLYYLAKRLLALLKNCTVALSDTAGTS